eukprot:m.6335 g.6335  ORF g.6335 m.6335 type:complete len:486 (-) comp3823_c0_seq1:226-1683(-)
MAPGTRPKSDTFCGNQPWRLPIGILVALVSGTFLAFGVYEEDLKNRLFFLGPRVNETEATHGRAQSETEALGTAVDLGDYAMHPIIGLLHDTVGPSYSSVIAAVLAGGGYVGVALCVGPGTSTSSLINPLGAALFAVGFGGGLGYMATLFHNSNHFPARYRSLVVGVLTSGFGISASVFSLSYRLGSKGRTPTPAFLEAFFLVWAAALGVVYLLSAFVLRRPRLERKLVKPKIDELEPLLINGDSVGEPRGIASQNGLCASYHRILTSTAFWLLAIPFWMAQGAALMVTNNLASIVNAVGTGSMAERKDTTLELAVLMSCSSVAGRLVAGVLGFLFHDRLPRGVLILVGCLVMAVSQFAFALVQTNTGVSAVYCLVVATGWSVGVLWTVGATITGEKFGLLNFGKNYGLIALGPGLTGLAFNTFASDVFDRHSRPVESADGESSRTCTGSVCFQEAFFVTGACCAVGTIICIWLIPLTRRVPPAD